MGEQFSRWDQEKTERNIKAHRIANFVCEVAGTYGEALYLLDKANNEVKLSMERKKAEAMPYPIDEWNNKIEMPDMEASGKRIDGISINLPV